MTAKTGVTGILGSVYTKQNVNANMPLLIQLSLKTTESLQNWCQQFLWSNSIVLNESCIAGVNTALTLTLGVN